MKRVGLVALGLAMYVVEGIDKAIRNAERNGVGWLAAYKIQKAQEEAKKEVAK